LPAKLVIRVNAAERLNDPLRPMECRLLPQEA
jgi:hypothetical protein